MLMHHRFCINTYVLEEGVYYYILDDVGSGFSDDIRNVPLIHLEILYEVMLKLNVQIHLEISDEIKRNN